MLENIKWLGHDVFQITENNLTIYTDPYKIGEEKEADLIFISHSHFDHCSPEDVKKIQGSNTTIVTTPDCAEKLEGDIKSVKPGDKINVKGVDIEVVPAYNIDKDFHPKANNWVGFIFTVGGKTYYFAGDTDYIPEMDSFKEKNIDIALIPVSGTYVMTAEEAVKATKAIKPKIAIPMHYGSIVGSQNDAQYFKEQLKDIVEVHIL